MRFVPNASAATTRPTRLGAARGCRSHSLSAFAADWPQLPPVGVAGRTRVHVDPLAEGACVKGAGARV